MADGSPAPLTCTVCSREACGLAVVDRFGSVRWRVCGEPKCIATVARWNDDGVAPATPYEREAMALAGRAGGQHLAALGKTDMKTLSRDEWAGFIRVTITSYQAELARLAMEQGPPF